MFGREALTAQSLANCVGPQFHDSVLLNQCDMHHIQFLKEKKVEDHRNGVQYVQYKGGKFTLIYSYISYARDVLSHLFL